jgi:hypothetical protein
MSQQGSLSIERMCQLAPVSRAGFYRSLQEGHPVEEEMRCETRFNTSPWRIAGGMAIVASRRNYGGAAC